MTRVLRIVAVLVVSLLVMTGCGSDPKPKPVLVNAFEVDSVAPRIFEAYGSTGDLTQKATLTKPVRAFWFHLDCVGAKGILHVAVTSGGGAGLTCGKGKSLIVESLRGPSATRLTITITAPAGARWSLALDGQVGKRS